MIDPKNFVNINLLKKETFTGSLNGMRYRMKKEVTEGDEPVTTLVTTIWPQPYNYAKTEEKLKESKEFEFSQDGVAQAGEWLNQSYINRKEYWKSSCMWKVLKE
ncbi:hypothetical protein [Anaerosporobacter faecicola]|uniref:hypothetical protein n=1 Tax=Anaerosporobacter faecicola TaxID=2718714 RepID=UPI00143BD174|nr:hypothetical protein [Anaerosporobacter faecicola]